MGRFLAWCEARGLAPEAVSPLHVAAYIRMHPGSAPTVKQHLAAIRMLGDWLVVSQVFMVNPAAAVRGPKHVVTKGATPVLSPPAEARRLLEPSAIDLVVMLVAALAPGADTAGRDAIDDECVWEEQPHRAQHAAVALVEEIAVLRYFHVKDRCPYYQLNRSV